jgi:hypothetical protein
MEQAAQATTAHGEPKPNDAIHGAPAASQEAPAVEESASPEAAQ